ncbi:asparagine synthase B [Arenimonas sp.]|uniref:asparagine synthase B n=1 Tax=Arenimonas sp. TaxID=1872635 RepID=UPI0025C3A3F5|nr:asparagine synthase B [Arenimonas sp.]
MCSILGVFDLRPGADLRPLRPLALSLSARQRHRGPDWSGVFAEPRCLLVHERLAIVDPAGGAQPLRSADGALALAVNGEIYNHRELERGLARPYAFQSGSDCEVINALYREQGTAGIARLNGIFAFALWDADAGRAVIARDPMGVCPLYWGHDGDGRLWVASEMKALARHCSDVAGFPPGHVYDTATGALTRYHERAWRGYDATAGVTVAPDALRGALEQAVHRQLMTDVPYGVLLSGGLDSSLVAACAARFARRRIEDDDGAEAWYPRLHSFAIGLPGSPDLAAAEVAAKALGTVHHGFTYAFEEGLDALPDVIRHIESYDVTTVRASTPMYLLARRIKAMGVKMVLSGEGADEIFGGYLYFHKAPDARSFHEECVRKLDALHQFDCLRANKAMMAWGVEARVPFLDLAFLDLAMSMDATAKMAGAGRIEKAVLREAFAGVLPDAILWRQKEQFSDGVGYGWIDGLKARAEAVVSDAMLAEASLRFPVNPPATKEAYWYRDQFEREFPGEACARTVPGGKSIACSSPAAIAWDPAFAAAADPSGRAVAGVHRAATGGPRRVPVSG